MTLRMFWDPLMLDHSYSDWDHAFGGFLEVWTAEAREPVLWWRKHVSFIGLRSFYSQVPLLLTTLPWLLFQNVDGGWLFCLLTAFPIHVDLASVCSCFLLCVCLREQTGKFTSFDFLYESVFWNFFDSLVSKICGSYNRIRIILQEMASMRKITATLVCLEFNSCLSYKQLDKSNHESNYNDVQPWLLT